MAERWSPGEGWELAVGKKTSSGRAGSSGVSGAGTGPVGTGVRPVGVQSRDPYIVGVLRGVAPERHREVLRREAQRLTDASAGHDAKINQRRAEKYRDEDPQIQGWLRLIRGTDAGLWANGGKPRPGTLNDRVQRIEAALGEPLRLVARPVVKPKPAGVQLAGVQPAGVKPAGVKPAGVKVGGVKPVVPKRYPAPLQLDDDVSAAPTDYVLGLLQNVPAGRQSARLRAELAALSNESAELTRKIGHLKAGNVPVTDPRIQGKLRRIRGTDAELQQRNGWPIPGSLNDRAGQIQAALAPPRPGELRRAVPQERWEQERQSPAPTQGEKWVEGVQAGIQHLANLKFSGMEAGRQADRAMAAKAERDADAAARMPRPGTRNFQKLTPAATVMDRFFHRDTRYRKEDVDHIVASREFQQARAQATPETRKYLDGMVARLRAVNGRTTDENQGTAELAGLVADVAGDKAFAWIGGVSRAKARSALVAKYGPEAVAEAEKRGFLDSLKAGGKTLVQDTKIRARMGARQGGATMAALNAWNEVLAGNPQGAPKAAIKGYLLGATGGAASEAAAPLRFKDAPAKVRAGQDLARGGLNFGVAEPLSALLDGERDPRRLAGRFVGGLLTGAAMHVPGAVKELRAKPVVTTAERSGEREPVRPALQPGDRVRVPARPELGEATVREVKGERAVLRPENPPRGAGVVKIRLEAIEHVQSPAVSDTTRGGGVGREEATTAVPKSRPVSVQAPSQPIAEIQFEILWQLRRGLTEKQLSGRLRERGYHPELTRAVLVDLQRQGAIVAQGVGKSAVYRSNTSRNGVLKANSPSQVTARANAPVHGDRMDVFGGSFNPIEWNDLEPLAGRPAGSRISDLLVIPDHPAYDELRRVAGVIDQLHGLGSTTIDPLPLKLDPSLPWDVLGRFETDNYNRPVAMLVKPSPLMGLVFAHEDGHFLDLLALGEPGFKASVTRHEEVRPITDLLYRSEAVAQLKDLYRAGVAAERKPNGEREYRAVDREKLSYLLRPQELWSRAYSQYVALRSADPTLRQQIDYLRSSRKGNIYRSMQWQEADFEPIAQAYDDLLKRKGWRR